MPSYLHSRLTFVCFGGGVLIGLVVGGFLMLFLDLFFLDIKKRIVFFFPSRWYREKRLFLWLARWKKKKPLENSRILIAD